MRLWYNIRRFFRRILGMSVSTMIPVAPNLNARMRKFRFIVINSGTDGGMSTREQPQIAIAPSPQYLVQLYAASGDKIRILEELPADDETRNYGKMNVDAAINGMNAQGWQASGNGLTNGKMMDFNESNEAVAALRAMHSGGGQHPTTQQRVSPQAPQQAQGSQQISTPAKEVSEPRYFNVGGMECKMENGKLYQKHWVTVNETEMANYRLISDKNNRILPMTGKHLEVLKWVIVEEDVQNA